MQHAKIDVWGVGTKLINAYDQPALGAVYKIVSIEDENGVMQDTIKLSNNAEKVSTPGKKQVWRIRAVPKGNLKETISPSQMLTLVNSKNFTCSTHLILTSTRRCVILMLFHF